MAAARFRGCRAVAGCAERVVVSRQGRAFGEPRLRYPVERIVSKAGDLRRLDKLVAPMRNRSYRTCKPNAGLGLNR